MVRQLSYTEMTGVRFLYWAPFRGYSIEVMHLVANQDIGEHYPLPAPFRVYGSRESDENVTGLPDHAGTSAPP